MNLRYHQISGEIFDALAAGGGGPAAISELAAAQYSKRALLLNGLLNATRGVGREHDSFAARGYQLLKAAQRHNRVATDKVICYPSVGEWARRTMLALESGPPLPGAEPGGLGTVAAAAAVRARITAEIEVPAPAGLVILPSLGAAEVGDETAVVRTANGASEISSTTRRVTVPADPHDDAPGWRGLRRIRIGSLDVGIDDLDRFRMPARSDVASRLSHAEIHAWSAVFRDGWPLLERRCRDLAAEIASAVSVIVPLSRPGSGQISSTSPEAFGAICMSAPPDPYTCAVTLAHEVQHLKLSALLDVVSLTRPDGDRRYYAPWRDDPRPIDGLLQGAYAYLGVSGFWRRQRHLTEGAERQRADREFARWRASVAQVVKTLKASGQLTQKGAIFVEGMGRTLDAWLAEPVPACAQALARRESQAHLTQWRTRNGPLPAG